jgi:membrane protease YdiL (CAAX protease family)
MESFIRLVESEKNGISHHIASLIVILFMWVFVGSLPLLAVVIFNGGAPFEYEGRMAVPGPLSGFDPFLTFYIPVALSFVALAAGVMFSVRYVLGRPLASLVTTRPKADMGRIGLGFMIFFAFNVIANAVSFLLEPSSFVLSFEPGRLLLFAPIYVILTIIQTSSEELLFRGYLLQAFGRAVRNPLMAAFLSSSLFMLVHLGNPEMSNGALVASAYYFVVGYWLCLVTLKDGGLELALGAHAANNLFILLLNYETSALEMVPSVFKMTGTGFDDMALSLALFVAMSAAAYYLLFRGNTGPNQPPAVELSQKKRKGRNPAKV